MTKDIQDLAWSILPKEFKEEVKSKYRQLARIWSSHNESNRMLLINIFGIDNLTSDAEEEEMLTVSRKRVQDLYNYHKSRGRHLAGDSLIKLFGSKCLPDDAKDDAKENKQYNVDTLADNVDSLESKPTDLNRDGPTCTDVCSSQVDERRLNIAATIAAGMAVDWYHEPQGGSINAKCRRLAEVSIMITDALIAECMTPTNNN